MVNLDCDSVNKKKKKPTLFKGFVKLLSDEFRSFQFGTYFFLFAFVKKQSKFKTVIHVLKTEF